MSEILSPEEVDALLKGVSSGDVESGTGFGVPPGEARDVDLANPEWISRNQLPPLGFLNQLLARHLKGSIRPMLKNLAEVTAAEARLVSYADYLVTLTYPTRFHLTNVPELDSHVLFVLSADLILNYVDFYYGGVGVHESPEALTRDFTVTETGVATRLQQTATRHMALAWEQITPLSFEDLGTESNPEFSNFFNPADVLVLSRFEVSLPEQPLGWLDIMIPKAALDPYRRLLESGSQGDQTQKQGRWRAAFEEQVRNTEIELSSVLSTTRINLGQLVRLRVGDILPFDLPGTVELTAGSMPLFKGTFGVANGHNAIRIVERLG